MGAERNPIHPRHIYLKFDEYAWIEYAFHSKKHSGGGHTTFLMKPWILINKQKTHNLNSRQSTPITPPTNFKFQIGGHPRLCTSFRKLCKWSIMLNHMAWSKLGGCTWSEYSLTSLIWHLFIWHPRYYDTFLRDHTFQFKTPSFIWLRYSIMRHLESPCCHIKKIVNAKISFIYVMYI